MDHTRRTFLKVAGAAGAVTLAGRSEPAHASAAVARHARGMLVDTTLCVGCRGCGAACSEKNGLPAPAMAGNPAVFDTVHKTDTGTYTVVNRYANTRYAGRHRFIKTQCMHCVEPGCASACPVKALEKMPEGAVIYHSERCLGCRYCMVACPFRVPRFEYDKALPLIRKCGFCFDLQQAGRIPACAQVCSTGALLFGEREALLEAARTRIYQNPDKYVHHIYGEHEAGGTSWLYISDVPFDRLGLRPDVGDTAYASLAQGALSAVPMVLTIWPPLLMGLYSVTRLRERAARGERATGKETPHA
jgi:Fe-S-cluster-containing dehydrogenase component